MVDDSPRLLAYFLPSLAFSRRRLVLFGVLLLLFVGVPTLAYLAFCRFADEELRHMVNRLDTEEPGWRVEDLESKQVVIAPEANAALRVLEAHEALPKPWYPRNYSRPSTPGTIDNYHDLLRHLNDLSPVTQLDVGNIFLLGEILHEAGPALRLALELPRYRQGRFPNERDTRSFPEYCEQLRTVTDMLLLDAALRAQREDMTGALRVCEAMLQASRAIGDDLSMYPQFMRLSCRESATRMLERVLAQGQPSVAELDAVRKLLDLDLAEEHARPFLLHGLRGERALLHRYLTQVERQGVSVFRSGSHPPIAAIMDPVLADAIKLPHAGILEFLSRLLAALERPIVEQQTALTELDAECNESYQLSWITQFFRPLVVVQHYQRSTAQARCAAVGLAVERFRIAHDRWPESLAELPPLADHVAIDPFGGDRLRYRKLPDGVVIYSLGPDGADDGGIAHDPRKNAINAQETGTDIVFRLWDVSERRQPPPPPPPPPADKELPDTDAPEQ